MQSINEVYVRTVMQWTGHHNEISDNVILQTRERKRDVEIWIY